MITLFLLVLGSIGIILAAERHPTTRNAMQKLTQVYSPGTCRSFILDVIFLLPLVGLLVEVLAQRVKNYTMIVFLPIVTAFILIPVGINTKNVVFVSLGVLLFCLFFATLFKKDMPRVVLYSTAYGIFLAISLSLYFDFLNFNFLNPHLGHPEAWGGNHFMWNSGIEVLGLKPLIDITVPTYKNFWGFWNILAILFLGPIYILVMVKMGTWLHGLLFGYTEKQTGISALFFERKTH